MLQTICPRSDGWRACATDPASVQFLGSLGDECRVALSQTYPGKVFLPRDEIQSSSWHADLGQLSTPHSAPAPGRQCCTWDLHPWAPLTESHHARTGCVKNGSRCQNGHVFQKEHKLSEDNKCIRHQEFFHLKEIFVFQTKVVRMKEADKDAFYSVGQMLFRLGTADSVIEEKPPDVLVASLVKWPLSLHYKIFLHI